jgi:hypothetical protein
MSWLESKLKGEIQFQPVRDIKKQNHEFTNSRI